MDALALANTVVARRDGALVDTLDPALAALGLGGLRDAIRELFSAAAGAASPPAAAVAAAVAAVNAAAGAPRLEWRAGGRPALVTESGAAEAARTAIELLASGRVRRCGNGRCVQFFLADGRRGYCSAACGNRARVARHAARAGRTGGPRPGAA